jgi:phosphotransferase system HPr (HPr) family protein
MHLSAAMANTKLTRSVILANANGLHARPADLLVKTANKFASNITIVKGAERIDAKSILGILTLAAMQGTELTVEAEGADAEQAVNAIADMLAKPFPDEA